MTLLVPGLYAAGGNGAAEAEAEAVARRLHPRVTTNGTLVSKGQRCISYIHLKTVTIQLRMRQQRQQTQPPTPPSCQATRAAQNCSTVHARLGEQ